MSWDRDPGKEGYRTDPASQIEPKQLPEDITTSTAGFAEIGSWVADHARKRG